jgi:hypothetical protein
VAIKIMEILHGKKYIDELKFMPLSDNTVSKRIREISDDMHEQLLERIGKSPNFAIQLDESTSISDLGQLRTICVITLRIVCMKTYCFVSHWKEDIQVKTFL